ncbi:MAG TPA: hypothetical protein VF487_09830 [Chitinophagaceae bacterium]
MLIIFLFFFIYYQVFFADYAYLDEIHQLWHNKDGSNYNMFFSQGRWLTGLLINKLFGGLSAIDELKYLRIFSFTGWVITTIVWHIVFSKWVRAMKLDSRLPILSDVFIASCIAVSIYIGWASCLELFIATGAGLISGHLLFYTLHGVQGYLRIPTTILVLSIAAGLCSLFLYQSAFGIFLLPFLIYYIQSKKIKPDRIVWIGIATYFFIYVIYYFLFRYSLQHSNVQAGDRVGISLDVLKKASFFFSGPLPSAFSINILYSPRSIFSQIAYPLISITWIIGLFRQNRKQKIISFIWTLGIIIIFLLLIYLPSMIAIESFASYRTLFPFNLAVFILVMMIVLPFFQSGKKRNYFTLAICLFLLATGFYNYNFQLINPLKAEYSSVKSFFEKNYTDSVKQVHFIRADKFMFRASFCTEAYRDEFGVPSTHRDWVPEPLVRQLVYEKEGKKEIAENISIVQYPDTAIYRSQHPSMQKGDLIIDMNKNFYEHCKKR